MSLVLSSRRRICVLFLYRARLHETPPAPALAPVQRALDTGFAPGVPSAQHSRTRLALCARVQRQWGRSLLGLSFFVLAVEPDEGPR
jgi:hypothetical protein